MTLSLCKMKDPEEYERQDAASPDDRADLQELLSSTEHLKGVDRSSFEKSCRQAGLDPSKIGSFISRSSRADTNPAEPAAIGRSPDGRRFKSLADLIREAKAGQVD